MTGAAKRTAIQEAASALTIVATAMVVLSPVVFYLDADWLGKAMVVGGFIDSILASWLWSFDRARVEREGQELRRRRSRGES